MKIESRAPGVEHRGRRIFAARSAVPHSSFVIRRLETAFTLIELLTVIAIVGILAALLAPVLKNFSKPDVTVSATRQMLDDVGRARQIAISQRTTVFMVFVQTNFWQDLLRSGGPNGWTSVQVPPAPFITASTTVTQLYSAQFNGYMMVSLRDVGDQPGRTFPKDVMRPRSLPQGACIAPFKFFAPTYISGLTPAYPLDRPDLPIYGFLRTNTIPFPSADITTNAFFMSQYNLGTARYVTVPFIAFNYLGQLTAGDGTVLPYDENIPLAYGNFSQYHDPVTKAPIQPPLNAAAINFTEIPAGNSTNISYNVIHIDRLTGRARLERQDVL